MATIAEILARSLGPPRPPPPNYMPNFDAANPDPAEPLQLKPLGRGYVLPDYTQHEQDQNAVEAAASRYRIANQQPDPENRGVAHDLALAAGAPPLIADAAGMLAPRPPKTPLDLATMGMGAGTFLGIGSRTADKAAYKLANEMEKAGRHPEVIRQTTGWQRAADGNWKYEISDAGAKFTGVKSGKLSDVFDHPELYAAHPEIGDIKATVGDKGAGSYFQPSFPGRPAEINIDPVYTNPLDTAIHEIGHGVQDVSGFAPGTNNFVANLKPGHPAWDIYQEKLKTAPQKTLSFLLSGKEKPLSPLADLKLRVAAMNEHYARSAGENEANNAMDRRLFTPEQIKAVPPQATTRVPYSQQIVEPPRVPGNKAPEPQFQVEGPKFVGPPPETDRARLTSFYNTAADQMALDPKDRFQPDPSHQVIDTNYQTPPPFVGPPQDLSQLYARHPDPAAALPTKDRARFFTDPVRKEAIAQKLVEKIQASGVMNSDARYFYGSAGPLFRAARKAGLTLNDAMAWIRDFGSITGATSPRTEVVLNVRNATSVMAKEAAGIPHREILGPGTTNAKTGEPGISERGYPMMTGEGKGGLHGQLIDDVLSGRGINPLTNTKPAVFEKQVGQGNLSGVTADTHIVRGAVMTANELYPGQIPIDWIKAEHRAAYRANPSRLTPNMVDDTLGSQMVDGQKMQTEFPVIADLYHRAAQILKVDPAEAQAMGWFGMGGQTNLGSQLETVAKVLNDRISVTAQALGKTPEWVAEQVFRRRIPVMSLLGGTAAGAAAVGAAGQPLQPPGGT